MHGMGFALTRPPAASGRMQQAWTAAESLVVGTTREEVMKSHVSTTAAAVALILLGWSAGSAPALAAAAADPGVRAASATDTFGNPVPGLTADQTTLFLNGQASFKQLEQVTDGLGPRFNLDSCVGCHSFPTHGGSAPAVNPQVALATAFGANNVVPTFLSTNGPIREARFKFTANGVRDGGVHSLFVVSGRVDASGSAAGCTAVQENFNAQFAAGNVSLRIPTPTYGTGLIEQIPDTTLTANLAANAAQKRALGISGHLNTNPNDGRISRFGWKAQNVSLYLFAGEAYNVEEGITNEMFQTERDLNPTCQFKSEPNDFTAQTSPITAANLNSDITNFALYMRLLAAPTPSATIPGGATSIANGQQTFNSIGCSMCHTPALKTDTSTSVAALGNQTAALYSDLALHRMGPALADNVLQGAAAGDEFRTAPLWGLGERIFFLHDGRTSNLVQAIQDHASGGNSGGGREFEANGSSHFGPSEANRVIANYNALSGSQQQDLLNFLRSL
jgi:CxxC motif-containing protein (DUF1111 family)